MAPPSPHSGLLSGGGGADAPLPRPQLAPAALLCKPLGSPETEALRAHVTRLEGLVSALSA